MSFISRTSMIIVAAALAGPSPLTAAGQYKAPSQRSERMYCFFNNGDIRLSSQIFTLDESDLHVKVAVVQHWISFLKGKHNIFGVGYKDGGCPTTNVDTLKKSHLRQGWVEVNFPVDELLAKDRARSPKLH